MASTQPSKGSGINSINITPMVDIILVLLVIFMVTSSAINASEAIEVDKPQATSGAPQQEPATTLVITCDKDGAFYAGEERLADGAAVQAHAKAVLAGTSAVQAVLRCDRDASVDNLVTAIDALRVAGVTKYAIATQPPAPGLGEP